MKSLKCLANLLVEKANRVDVIFLIIADNNLSSELLSSNNFIHGNLMMKAQGPLLSITFVSSFLKLT